MSRSIDDITPGEWDAMANSRDWKPVHEDNGDDYVVNETPKDYPYSVEVTKEEYERIVGAKFSDSVLHPPHYNTGAIETWDYIIDQQLSYLLGNVVKYVSRAGKKGDAVEDLRKARAYLDKEIERLNNG